ncbi:MAG: DUF58 domain-containing protein [Candidatus Omnitrophota bacterium]
MFTSKSVFLLIVVIILLAIAWNSDVTMVYIFFVVGFVMFLLSFIHLQFNVPDVTISREVQGTAYEGDIINIRMTILNRRGLPLFFFELLDMFPGGPPEEKETSLFVLALEPKEDKKISYIANCYQRGHWKIGPTTIISQDALGFFRAQKVIKIFSEILVYPSLFRIFSFPQLASGSVSWMGVETAKISGDSHEFFGVREYQKGDAMSRIHWASSARHNKLIVKQFERNAVQEATIALDLKKENNIGSGKDTTLEYAVKIAGSIAKYLLSEGVMVQMVGYSKEAVMLPFGKGESHMYKILEYLANVRADGDFTLSHVLEEVSFVTPYRSTLITVMLDNDTDSLSSLVQFKVKGIKLIVIVLAASTFGHMAEEKYLNIEESKRFDEALANLEAIVYRISKGDDLEKKFEAV